jgi:hypothetical protein
MSDNTTGVYMISGCAVPAQNLGDHGYFGLSIDIDRRFDDHERSLKKGTHGNKYLQNCFNLYGGSNYFIWSIVEECPAESLSDREIHYITEGNTYQNPKGFNMTPGGEKGINQAACKSFAFKDTKTNTLLCGTNLAQFCREQPQYDYQQMSKLRRGDIQMYKHLVALETPEIQFDKPNDVSPSSNAS